MDDIYSNLDNYEDENCMEQLRAENADLRFKIETITDSLARLQANILQDYDNLKIEYKKVTSNYSSLLKTAKAEILRKTQQITALNTEKDQLMIRYLSDSTNRLPRYKKLNNFRTNIQRKDSNSDKNNTNNVVNIEKRDKKQEPAEPFQRTNADPGHLLPEVESISSTSECSTPEVHQKSGSNISREGVNVCKDITEKLSKVNKEEIYQKKEFKENVSQVSNTKSSKIVQREKAKETNRASTLSNRRKSMPDFSKHLSPQRFSSDSEAEESTSTKNREKDKRKTEHVDKGYSKQRSRDRERSPSLDDKSSGRKSSSGSYDRSKQYRNYDIKEFRSKDPYASRSRRWRKSPELTRRGYRNRVPDRELEDGRFEKIDYERRKMKSPPHKLSSHSRDGSRPDSRNRFSHDKPEIVHRDYKATKHRLDDDHVEELCNKRARFDSLPKVPSNSYKEDPSSSYNRKSHESSDNYNDRYRKPEDNSNSNNDDRRPSVEHSGSYNADQRKQEAPSDSNNDRLVKSGDTCDRYNDRPRKSEEVSYNDHLRKSELAANTAEARVANQFRDVDNDLFPDPKCIKTTQDAGHKVPLMDPRLASRKYTEVLDDKNNVCISTVAGRNVDLKIVLYDEKVHINPIARSNVDLSEEFIEDIYMDIDNEIHNLSVESGEIRERTEDVGNIIDKIVESNGFNRKLEMESVTKFTKKPIPNDEVDSSQKPRSSLNPTASCSTHIPPASTATSFGNYKIPKLNNREDTETVNFSCIPNKEKLVALTTGDINYERNKVETFVSKVSDDKVQEKQSQLPSYILSHNDKRRGVGESCEKSYPKLSKSKVDISEYSTRQCVVDDLELSDDNSDCNEHNSFRDNYVNSYNKDVLSNANVSVLTPPSDNEVHSQEADKITNDTSGKLTALFGETSLITPEDLDLPTKSQTIPVLESIDEEVSLSKLSYGVDDNAPVEKRSKRSSRKHSKSKSPDESNKRDKKSKKKKHKDDTKSVKSQKVKNVDTFNDGDEKTSGFVGDSNREINIDLSNEVVEELNIQTHSNNEVVVVVSTQVTPVERNFPLDSLVSDVTSVETVSNVYPQVNETAESLEGSSAGHTEEAHSTPGVPPPEYKIVCKRRKHRLFRKSNGSGH